MGCGGSKPDTHTTEANTVPGTRKVQFSEVDVSQKGSAVLDEPEPSEGPLSQTEIDSRIQGMDKFETFELGISGFILRYGVLSQRGYYPEDLYKANQDRYLISPKFNGKKGSILMGVFDGHGPEGDLCAEYVRKRCIPVLTKLMKEPKYQFNFSQAYIATWVKIDEEMHDSDDFNDSSSGSTSICAVFQGKEMYISNIGDSRAIIGERTGKRILAHPLSVDQTPYRRDERERVKNCGASIMTQGMVAGTEEYYEGWEERMISEELDGSGDPPRIYETIKDKWGNLETLDRPGCAFTRSLGDSSASHLGVYAEAELLHKQIREQDQMIAIASDGVWEFLSNQSVCDTVMQFDDPIEACRQVISQAYGLWLQFEVRTDDITLMVMFIDTVGEEGKAPRAASEEEIAMYADRRTTASPEGTDYGLSLSSVEAGQIKPVRRGLSSEKKKELGVSAQTDEDESFLQGEWKMEVVTKTKAEVERIKAALKGNFLFAHLPPQQAKMIYDVMKRRPVKAKETIIKQGDPGNSFFILDDGEFRVTIEKDGKQIEILRYKPNPAGANPCFGELALMYSKPRAASVTALTDGSLWEIDRRSFREILKKSSTKYLMRTLRSVEVLKSLSVAQMQRLSEILSEVTYKPGDFVLKQGEEGDTFFIISSGQAVVTKNDDRSNNGRQVGELYAGQYFGERALLKEEPRAANVIASGDSNLHCLSISKDAFEEVLGPLQDIMDQDATWRYKLALVKQLKKNAAGLSNAKIEDFAIIGCTAQAPPVRYILATHKQKQYTIKVRSKKQVVEMNMQARLRAEMKLLTSLNGTRRLIPLALQTLEDDSYVYSIVPTRVATLLSMIIDSTDKGLTEKDAMFFAGCIIQGLDHIHNEMPVMGGIIYRNLDPNSITVDVDGWPQLMDMRYAVQAEPPPRDYCGQSHYLSPEQVQGQGHGTAIDFWALGVLIYEMVSLGNPWLTGNAKADSELNIYSRISDHRSGALQFPNDLDITDNLKSLLNDLLEPDPDKRLGMRVGVAGTDKVDELRNHPWFAKQSFDWGEVMKGALLSPFATYCARQVAEIEKDDTVKRSIDELFNEVYIPKNESVDEFDGVTDTSFSRSGGMRSFGAIAIEASALHKKSKVQKRMRAKRYERLQSKGMLRNSMVVGLGNMRHSVAAKLRMSRATTAPPPEEEKDRLHGVLKQGARKMPTEHPSKDDWENEEEEEEEEEGGKEKSDMFNVVRNQDGSFSFKTSKDQLQLRGGDKSATKSDVLKMVPIGEDTALADEEMTAVVLPSKQVGAGTGGEEGGLLESSFRKMSEITSGIINSFRNDTVGQAPKLVESSAETPAPNPLDKLAEVNRLMAEVSKLVDDSPSAVHTSSVAR